MRLQLSCASGNRHSSPDATNFSHLLDRYATDHYHFYNKGKVHISFLTSLLDSLFANEVKQAVSFIFMNVE